MSKRITLSVPDALHDKIEEWRTSFNLSRVFQDAVAEVIRRKENLQARFTDDLPQVIARLKREKSEAEEDWYRRGAAAGAAWARSAHWLELKGILSRPAAELAGPEGELRDYFRELFERELGDAAADDTARLRLLAGWQQGVGEFWSLVRDKI